MLIYSVIRDTPARPRYITKQCLRAEIEQQRHNKRAVPLTGKKRAQETGYFTKMTWAFGTIAAQIAASENDSAIAVFFRNTDCTNSTKGGVWVDKRQSIAPISIMRLIGAHSPSPWPSPPDGERGVNAYKSSDPCSSMTSRASALTLQLGD